MRNMAGELFPIEREGGAHASKPRGKPIAIGSHDGGAGG